MNDLQELAKTKSWLELTTHLTDILPSKRDIKWQALAELALVSHFKALTTAADSTKTFAFLNDTFPKFPFLIKNKEFMTLRSEFGTSYYEPCFSYNNKDCHKELLGFIKIDPDPFFAFKIAKQVRRRYSNNKAIEYYALALSQKAPKSSCHDSDLKIALESALQTKPNSNYAKAAKKVAFGQCFKALRKNIIIVVKANDNAKNNACKELISRKAIKGITHKKCTRFLKK